MRILNAAKRQTSARVRRWGLLALLVVLAAFAAFASPTASAHGQTRIIAQHSSHPTHATHATPVRSDPPADDILSAPPSQVKMWFSEALNPLASRIVVVDPTNHEVDTRDSRVNPADQTEMVVGLQLLRPGTYVVVWRTQSAVDGHVTGGSFLFRIANADGSVPPVPATLPSGNVPGAAGFGASGQTIDGPTLLQTAMDWLALLFTLFWVGGVLWEAWVLSERRASNAVVALGARLAVRRFQRLAPYALLGALLANLGEALALTVQVAGSWRGVFAGQFWQATLFSGSFGVYWWMRQAILALALALAWFALRRSASKPDAETLAAPDDLLDELLDAPNGEATPIPSWTRAALDTLRQAPRLPAHLIGCWLDLSPLRQGTVALAALLLFALAMSGHAAATLPSVRTYAITVDLAHLIFSAIWLGGLFYISVVLIPAARRLPERTRALLLAYGVPEFSVIAILSAAALALTGSLNAGVRLTSLAQFATTAYGRTLFVKIEIFLFMVGISAFHAFWLRPRLASALARSTPARAAIGARVGGVSDSAPAAAGEPLADEADVRRLRERMEDWLRREALLGVGVLLCVALLALFAGSLTSVQASLNGPTAAFSQTHTVSGYAVTLQVAPAKFGANTFTVRVADGQGRPVSGASTLLLLQSLTMDMGVQNAQLQPVGASQPGVYRGSSDLTMAGQWSVVVKVLPPGGSAFVATTFTFPVGS